MRSEDAADRARATVCYSSAQARAALSQARAIVGSEAISLYGQYVSIKNEVSEQSERKEVCSLIPSIGRSYRLIGRSFSSRMGASMAAYLPLALNLVMGEPVTAR